MPCFDCSGGMPLSVLLGLPVTDFAVCSRASCFQRESDSRIVVPTHRHSRSDPCSPKSVCSSGPDTLHTGHPIPGAAVHALAIPTCSVPACGSRPPYANSATSPAGAVCISAPQGLHAPCLTSSLEQSVEKGVMVLASGWVARGWGPWGEPWQGLPVWPASSCLFVSARGSSRERPCHVAVCTCSGCQGFAIAPPATSHLPLRFPHDICGCCSRPPPPSIQVFGQL